LYLFFSLRDNAHGRILNTEQPDDANLTVESCIAFCQSGNFSLAGMEFGVQCCELNPCQTQPQPSIDASCTLFSHGGMHMAYYFCFPVCDNDVINGGSLASADTDCDMGCGGNSRWVGFF
jgi:hypothetical protein